MPDTRLIVDTDPGTDDAIALLMLLAASERVGMGVVGITTVGGNVACSRATRNTLALLEYLGREHMVWGNVPVVSGASKPLKGYFPYAHHFHGPGGIGVRLPEPKIVALPQNAVDFLRSSLLETDGPMQIVALGPLTNLATLLKKFPEVVGNISRIVIMGGAVGVPGNVTPYAEFNFYSDPLAAYEVFSSQLELTLVDLGACRQAAIGRNELVGTKPGTKAGKLTRRILNNWFRRHPDKEFYELCDPLAMAVAFDPDIVSIVQGRVEVETSNPETLGQSILYPGKGNTSVARDVDTERFFKLFYGALG